VNCQKFRKQKTTFCYSVKNCNVHGHNCCFLLQNHLTLKEPSMVYVTFWNLRSIHNVNIHINNVL
jgi:hypothetical protein